jgi:hypothetical protein
MSSKISYAQMIKTQKVVKPDTKKINEIKEVDTGSSKRFDTVWVLWAHTIDNKDWSLSSYKKLYEIRNVSEFWKIFNNLEILGMYVINLFLMKQGVSPTWEDKENRHGGTCSFKIEMLNSKTCILDLAILLVTNKLTENGDVNGISISPKNTWAIIKIWNKDKKYDLTKTLNKVILDKYNHLSIKYNIINPED